MGSFRRLAVAAGVAAGAIACGGSSGGSAAAPFIAAQVIALPAGLSSFQPSVTVAVCADATCANPIPTAAVTVNGQTVSWDGLSQQYASSQGIAAGQPVTLAVAYGGRSFRATATQFVAPTFASPASPASWTNTIDNSFVWTGGSPASGADYVAGVYDSTGTIVFPASASGNPEEIPVSSGTTSLTVPAGALAAGTYTLLAGIGTPGIVGGTGTGIPIPGAAAGSGLWLGAAADPVTVTVIGVSSIPFVTAYVASVAGDPLTHASVQVCSDVGCTLPVTNAAVVLNTQTLVYQPSSGDYDGTLPVIGGGGSVFLSVTVGPTTYTAEGVMVGSPPAITVPAANAAWSAGAANAISWSGAPTSLESALVYVSDGTGTNILWPSGGMDEVTPSSASTTSVTVPAGALSPGSDLVFVGSGTPTASPIPFLGAAPATGSGLWLRSFATVPITVN